MKSNSLQEVDWTNPCKDEKENFEKWWEVLGGVTSAQVLKVCLIMMEKNKSCSF